MQTKTVSNNFKDIKKVKKLAIEAFPNKEGFITKTLVEMSEKGEIEFLALYDNNLFIGFVVVKLYKDLAYLFFLAIDSQLRSRGYGSKTLKLLEKIYPSKQQVVDLEKLDDNAVNSSQRIKRRSFYTRNGYLYTGRFLSYHNTNYEILCKDKIFDFEMFKEMMITFNIEGFTPKYF